MRHSAVEQIRTIHRLLVQQTGQAQVQLGAGQPQILGTVQCAQRLLESRHRPGIAGLGGHRPGRAEQNPAQRFAPLGHRLGRPVQQRHRGRRVSVVECLAGLGGQHDGSQLAGRRSKIGRGIAAPDGEQHHINQDPEFAQHRAQFGRVRRRRDP